MTQTHLVILCEGGERVQSPEYKSKITVTIGYFCSSVQQGYWCFQVFIFVVVVIFKNTQYYVGFNFSVISPLGH